MNRILASQTPLHIGKEILLQGFINSRRDHGKIMFLDLRDRSGLVQMVSQKALADAKPEDVVEVTGIVRERPQQMVNTNMVTGTVEVEVKTLTILSKSRELPFPLDNDGYDIKEDLRLKYRYLDLRRTRLQRNIKLRSRFVDLVRQYLFSQDFTEIETPLLTKSTPEGSRDFLVPSRLQPGKFYALPQSPQQYKQLLMAAGFERYFQIARCLRDEDLRADRGFEHTQIDLEMSFVNREDVMALDEGMMIHIAHALGYKIKQIPFPVFTYKQAMEQFGRDKFDLRSDDDRKQGVLAFAWVVDFPFFEKTDDGGWTFTHNPFSNPKPEHMEWLMSRKNIGDILTTQYDIVCNGYEVGGGSIRSNNPDVLTAVFDIMGYGKERISSQFGHMLDAFRYGVPPHGGLAHGIERLLMTLTDEPYLREVVAFPQSTSGLTSVMDAPSPVDESQLEEVGLSLIGHAKELYDRIVTELDAKNIMYKKFEHEPVRTSEEAARARNTPIAWGAKAILLYTDDKPVMVVVAGDTKIDTKAFKHFVDVRDVRMATAEEVQQVTTVPIGAVPPFGHYFGIPLYMDEKVKLNESVVFNAGKHERSIQMTYSDYEKIAKPVIGSFSKAINAQNP